MDVINPALRSTDMQSATVEVNLIPPQVADFRGTQPVPVRNQAGELSKAAAIVSVHMGNGMGEMPGS
jgi:hypothetical protein